MITLSLKTSGNSTGKYGAGATLALGTQYNVAELAISPTGTPTFTAETLYNTNPTASVVSSNTFAIDATAAISGSYDLSFGVGAEYGFGDSSTFKVSLSNLSPVFNEDYDGETGNAYSLGGVITITVGSKSYYFKVDDLSAAGNGLGGLTGVQVTDATGSSTTKVSSVSAELVDGVFYNYKKYSLGTDGVPDTNNAATAAAAKSSGFTTADMAISIDGTNIKVYQADEDGIDTATDTAKYTLAFAADKMPLLSATTRAAMATVAENSTLALLSNNAQTAITSYEDSVTQNEALATFKTAVTAVVSVSDDGSNSTGVTLADLTGSSTSAVVDTYNNITGGLDTLASAVSVLKAAAIDAGVAEESVATALPTNDKAIYEGVTGLMTTLETIAAKISSASETLGTAGNTSATLTAASESANESTMTLQNLLNNASALTTAVNGISAANNSETSTTMLSTLQSYNDALHNYNTVLTALGGTEIASYVGITQSTGTDTVKFDSDTYSASLAWTNAKYTVAKPETAPVSTDTAKYQAVADLLSPLAAFTSMDSTTSELSKALSALNNLYGTPAGTGEGSTTTKALSDIGLGSVADLLAGIDSTNLGETYTTAVAKLFTSNAATGDLAAITAVDTSALEATATSDLAAGVSAFYAAFGTAAETAGYDDVAAARYDGEVIGEALKAMSDTDRNALFSNGETYATNLQNAYRYYVGANTNDYYKNALDDSTSSNDLMDNLNSDAKLGSSITVGDDAAASKTFKVEATTTASVSDLDVGSISSTSTLGTSTLGGGGDNPIGIIQFTYGGSTYYGTIDTDGKLDEVYDSTGATSTTTTAIKAAFDTTNAVEIDGSTTTLGVKNANTYLLYATGANSTLGYSAGDLVAVENAYSAAGTLTLTGAGAYSDYKTAVLANSGVTYESNGATTSYSGSFNITLGSDTATFNFTSDAGVFALTLDSASSDVGVTNVSSDSFTFTYDGITYTVDAASYSEISVSATAVPVDVETTNGASATTFTKI